MKRRQLPLVLLPVGVGLLCLAAFVLWLSLDATQVEKPRLPVQWPTTGGRSPDAARQGRLSTGELTPGQGKPSQHPGDWPQFRGPGRDNIAVCRRELARAWPLEGPKVLWRAAVGEGHAGAAIHQGRVYLIDYDRDKKLDAVRCLSLDSGEEIWRYSYPVEIKRNHGMSRTVPAVNDQFVVTIGPKCHVTCLDAPSGKLIWKKDLVAEYGTTVPPWYAGQCPLIDGNRLILAPGAKPLMMAIELATGKTIWTTPDHEDMGMTHSSIMALNFNGKKQYIYCAHRGVVGVAAEDGKVLWTKPDWKINIANVPSPIPVSENRIFFSGGYDTGCAMVRLVERNGALATEELFRLKPTVFGSDQQTPILYQNYLYGVIPGGRMACLDLAGNRVWDSGGQRFGLGPYMIANGLLYAVSDEDGILHLAEVNSNGYKELAKQKILNGHDAWGPLAMAEGRLILRDLTEMACVDVGR